MAVATCLLVAVADANDWWTVFAWLKPAIIPLFVSIPLFPIAALVAWVFERPRQRKMLLVVLVSVLLSALQIVALVPLYA